MNTHLMKQTINEELPEIADVSVTHDLNGNVFVKGTINQGGSQETRFNIALNPSERGYILGTTLSYGQADAYGAYVKVWRTLAKHQLI